MGWKEHRILLKMQLWFPSPLSPSPSFLNTKFWIIFVLQGLKTVKEVHPLK